MKKVIMWILVTSAIPLSYLYLFLKKIWFFDKEYSFFSFEGLTLFWIVVLSVVLTVSGLVILSNSLERRK